MKCEKCGEERDPVLLQCHCFLEESIKKLRAAWGKIEVDPRGHKGQSLQPEEEEVEHGQACC
jgi:hypothetical protein